MTLLRCCLCWYLPPAFAPISRSSGPLTVHCNTPYRSPVPESDSAEEEKTQNFLHATADMRAGEALSPTEVPGFRRESSPGQGTQNDWCTSQNMVPEQKDKMEVGTASVAYSWYTVYCKLQWLRLQSSMKNIYYFLTCKIKNRKGNDLFRHNRSIFPNSQCQIQKQEAIKYLQYVWHTFFQVINSYYWLKLRNRK